MGAYDRAAARDAAMKRGLARDHLKAKIDGLKSTIEQFRQAQLDAQEDEDLAAAAQIGRDIVAMKAELSCLYRQLEELPR